jgi:hypothetical protein
VHGFLLENKFVTPVKTGVQRMCRKQIKASLDADIRQHDGIMAAAVIFAKR